MRIIVGFGNDLRGEDGFGIEVINELEKVKLKNTELISTFQLTPELSLQLKEADEIVFIDAAFSQISNYTLACSFEETQENNLSHHISIRTIMAILESVYNVKPKYEVYSMLTSNFDEIYDKKKYDCSIKKVVEFIKNS